MPLGDGIRRNIAQVSPAERDRFINAILKLDTVKVYPDGVSYWDKQEDIHKNAHFAGVDVHAGIGFIPWHRAIVNHFEELLREVDPALSLHYWDWTTDPRVAPPGGASLFTDIFMDNPSGTVSHLLKDFESSEDAELGNGHTKIWREVGADEANPDGTPNIDSDNTIVNHPDFNSFAASLKNAHDFVAHSYIGGTLTNAHYSFHDPFVFLLHSNLDRLWAKWQTDPAHPERLESATAYSGVSPDDLNYLQTEKVQPWAGGTGLEPWASDPTKKIDITYTDISIVTAPCYDTNQSNFFAVQPENELNSATNRFRIEFNNVPEEETTWRAAVIRVYSCTDATFRVTAATVPASPFGLVFPPFGDAVADHEHSGTHAYVDARVWFSFTAPAVGTAPQNLGPQNVNIECVENGQVFHFELVADTIPRPTVAVQLVLDQSGSMADPAGTSGLTRLQVLKDAATLFANIIQRNNGMGLIRFDQDAYPPNDATYGGMFITRVNSDSFVDTTRNTARNAILMHGAHGDTSVGDGIDMGRTQLNNVPAADYTAKAMIVLTDGIENEPRSIASVASSINNQTFAIGLGNETQVNTLALNNITQGSGGYLLLTGLISSSVDDYYRLAKYFMQILANVTNTQIVRDPNGYVNIGTKLKIPFKLCEADITARVILLNEFPIIRLGIEMPDGQLITQANAGAYNMMFDSNSKDTVTCSFPLPVLNSGTSNHSGIWYAVLEVDENEYRKYLNRKLESASPSAMSATKGAKYSVSIHSFSNLKMEAKLAQTGMEPGDRMIVRAKLSEYNIPLRHRAAVRGEVEWPDHSKSTLLLTEGDPGIYEAEMTASMAGIYHFLVVASGINYKGKPFTREQIFTGAVFLGANIPGSAGQPGRGEETGANGDCCTRLMRAMWLIAVLLILILVAILIGIVRHQGS